MNKILGFIKSLIPQSVKVKLSHWIFQKKLDTIARKQHLALKQLYKKDKLRCIFMAIDISVWKYDEVVRLMSKNPRFEPIIFVCPMVNHGETIMKEKMKQCISFYKQKGYNVISSYDEKNHRYVDLRKELNPDILFYTNPYQGLIDDRYFITNYLDILTVYVSYYISCSIDIDFCTNVLLYNLVWRKYVEYEHNLETCIKHAKNKGRNVVVSGYPGIEPLINGHLVKDPFKGDHRKRIIWAPHHTLNASIYGHSCFLMYADFMLKIAEKYKDSIILIFKPHPLLKAKLYNLWGTNRTNEYYKQWETHSNTFINEGEYIDLFLSSDAMIHDSGSFVVEYLYVNKPVMRTVNDVPLKEQFDDFALSCLEQYYMGNNEQDIEVFIQNVINNIDPLKDQRTNFISEVLMPKGSPSQNIINDILYSIDNQTLYPNHQ